MCSSDASDLRCCRMRSAEPDRGRRAGEPGGESRGGSGFGRLADPHGETAVLNPAVSAGAASAACRIRGDKDEFPRRPLFLVVAHCPSRVNIFWKESSN
jgi:hypothetical protein